MTMQFRQTIALTAPSMQRTLRRIDGIRRWYIGLAALACLANAPPEAEPVPEPEPQQAPAAAQVAGLYDGSSFETYMAMELLAAGTAEGTYVWEMTVGGLDLISRGVWAVRDGAVHFTTSPAPVPPEFRFVRFEKEITPSDKTVQVHVKDQRGRPFTDAETKIECANGLEITEFVAGSSAYFDGYIPDECDRPIAVTVVQSNFNFASPRFVLATMGWQRGQALRLEFVPNDIGVFDLTGMRGVLVDGVLSVEGPLGHLDFRKEPAPQR